MARKKQELTNKQFFQFHLKDLESGMCKKICDVNSACAIKISNFQGILNTDLSFWLYNKEGIRLFNLPFAKDFEEIFLLSPQNGIVALMPVKQNHGVISFDYEIIYF